MNAQSETKPYQKFRLPAMLIEGLAVFLILLGLILDHNQLKIIGFMTTAFMYMSVSFYLFKAEKFKTKDVLIAVFSGLLISIILMGFLFESMQWPQALEMLTISKLTLNFSLIFATVVVLANNLKAERRPFEYTMSLKLFSRFLILVIYYYASGIDQMIKIPI